MPNRDDETLDRAAGMLRAAGDEGRMRILAVLLDRDEASVSELAEATRSDPSTTSHRLRVLLSESLVVRRAEGRTRLYALADRHVRSLVENVLDHADRSVTLT
jgi:DNA-binding transcriptional ArsR family regulator